eukprot:3320272-Amphidinium_carterae.1
MVPIETYSAAKLVQRWHSIPGTAFNFQYRFVGNWGGRSAFVRWRPTASPLLPMSSWQLWAC